MKSKIMYAIIAALILLSIAGLLLPGRGGPIDATDMSAKERAAIDEDFIADKLERADYAIDSVKIKYANGTIRVYADMFKTDQYADDMAKDIMDETEDIIADERASMTLERDYYIISVYDKDGNLIR